MADGVHRCRSRVLVTGLFLSYESPNIESIQGGLPQCYLAHRFRPGQLSGIHYHGSVMASPIASFWTMHGRTILSRWRI